MLAKTPTLKRIILYAPVCGIIILVFVSKPLLAQPCPTDPPVTISYQLPSDVCIPSDFSGNPLKFFNDFSWRTFIALVWPAQHGQRGVPDVNKEIFPVSEPLVFETYKADWEIFQPSSDGTSPPPAPSPWNSYAGSKPCSIFVKVPIFGPTIDQQSSIPRIGLMSIVDAPLNIGFGDLVLGSFSKFSHLTQAGFGNLVGPLPAQNGTYTLYQTGFNKVGFDQILGQQLYLRSNLPTTNTIFQNGAINIKAAWIDMTHVANPERYYTRKAWVLNPFSTSTPTCTEITVGLVGLHIVMKTPSRPQWIWSTFEQIDNVPPSYSGIPFTYNNGDGTPMPASNPNLFPLSSKPVIFNVQRLKPTRFSTDSTNYKYQTALENLNSPWQFYRLVMTQWPTVPMQPPAQPIPPSVTGQPANTIPGTQLAADSAFANVTMETFFQNDVRTGCMACHDLTRNETDFNWTLQLNAWPSSVEPPSNAISAFHPIPRIAAGAQQRLSPHLRALKQLMENSVRH